ncbi:MAG: YafY family transcriptional regulator [Rubrivivax sp.]|nr:YafY family transcriptional regulator [Rubrivivax sp.]
MLASRLLSILMLLQSRGRMSAAALAEAHEVSLRTIYRDVDSLSAAGVPIYADRGRHGGFELRAGWRTQLTGLTAEEAKALFMAGLPGPAKALGLGDAAASAHLKLLAALPEDWRADAERVGARFHLDPVDWFRASAPADHLRLVAEGVWSERRLRMRYESWSGVSERTVEPLGLVLKGSAWYLVARAVRAERREPQTYRVGSIQAAELLDERFQRPARFDLAAFWSESTKTFEEGVYRDVATLRVSPRGFERLRRFGPIVAAAAARTAGEPGEDGWREVIVPIESPEYAAHEMLRLGPEAVVLEPAPLRAAMRDLASRMLAGYALLGPPRAGTDAPPNAPPNAPPCSLPAARAKGERSRNRRRSA